uniref:Putative ovo n=1 Tax=Culex tarsalis TaxID=7177 RepID=A0A1Q3EY13_CULTA
MSIFIKQELIINAEEEHAASLESTAIGDAATSFCALCIREVPSNGNFFEYNHQNSTEFRDLLGELFGIELRLQHFIVCRTCWKMLQMVGDFRECCFKGQSWMERFPGGTKSDDDWLSDEMTQMIDCLQAAIEDHIERIEQDDAIEEEGILDGKAQASDSSGIYRDDGMDGHDDYDVAEQDSYNMITAEALLDETSLNGLNTSKGEIMCNICNIPLKRDSLVKHKRSKRHRLQAKVHKKTQLNQVGNALEAEPSAESDQSDWYEELNQFTATKADVVPEKTPEEVECKICNIKFSRGANLDRHRLTKLHLLHAKEAGYEEEFGIAAVGTTCTVCNLTFGRNDYYQKHLTTKRHLMLAEIQNGADGAEIHDPPENESIPEPEVNQTSPDQIVAEQNPSNNAEEGVALAEHKCRFCQCLYANAYQLDKHIHKEHSDHMLQCRVMCKKRFLSKKNLILHEKVCREKSLSCSFCKVKCGSRKALIAHEKHFHNGTLWKCKYCDRRYKRRSDLQQHHQVKHGKEAGKHQCTLCGKCFNTAKTLEFHQFTHTGTRPYSCEHCGKGFIYYTGLNRHIRDVHKLPT